MPNLARDALLKRIERSGLLDRLTSDVRVLFRKRLVFRTLPSEPDAAVVEVCLRTGALTLGYLSLPASARPERNAAYRRWLELAARTMTDDIGRSGVSDAEALPAKILAAIRLIRSDYQEPLSLAQVAAAVGLSRERLCRLFHETLGITFSDYLNEIRLAEARRRLADRQASITEVAYASGFQSLSQFNRRFKAAEGVSPTGYRRRAERAPDRLRPVG